MVFTEESFKSLLPTLNSSGKFWVAYSGGLDSHVLLHVLTQAFPASSICALHINHGLSPNAEAWQQHCQQVCLELGVAFKVQQVEIDQSSSESLENLAREARYSVFNEVLAEDDCLLMGHHENDQSETLLFRLMRGTGPRGLGAIPRQRNLRNGQLLRPLLDFNRSELESYAKSHGLSWIEDESNKDTRFDRNFLRHEILPLLSQRWPGFEKRWQRSAQLCVEADQLQTVLGEQDLQMVQSSSLNRLDTTALKAFEVIRQRNILRVWFGKLEKKFGWPMPDYQNLQRIIDEVLLAPADAEPKVGWSKKVEVRRFANELYALAPSTTPLTSDPIHWELNAPLKLPNSLGTLSLEQVSSKGVNLSDINKLTICFRKGGEEAKPAGRKTRPLKKIFPDYGVPPWCRSQVPLIYLNDELVAVADLFICDKWQVEKGSKLYRFKWEKGDIHCGY